MATNVQSDLAQLRVQCRALQAKAGKLGGVKRLLNSFKKDAEQQVNNKQYMEKIIEARWTTQSTRATGGTPWKNKEVPNGKPNLVDTGNLRKFAIRAVKGTYRIDKTRFMLGGIDGRSRASGYASYIQNGTDKMAARPFMNDPTPQELKPANTYAFKQLIAFIMRLFR